MTHCSSVANGRSATVGNIFSCGEHKINSPSLVTHTYTHRPSPTPDPRKKKQEQNTHAATSPAAAPHPAEASLSDDLVQHDLFGIDDIQVVSLQHVPRLHRLLEPHLELRFGSGCQTPGASERG